VLGRWLGKEAVTLLKQTAVQAGIGLGVLGALSFGAEAAEAVVGETGLNLVVGTLEEKKGSGLRFAIVLDVERPKK